MPLIHLASRIIGTPLLRKIGALPDGIDRAAFENKGRVTIPSPMGALQTCQDWDGPRAKHPERVAQSHGAGEYLVADVSECSACCDEPEEYRH